VPGVCRSAAIITLFSCGIPAAEIHFCNETIAVSILPPDTVAVYGEYFFTNPDSTQASTSLYYPFPVDSISTYPFSISVADKKSSTVMYYEESPQGVLFNFPVQGGDTSIISVSYKQKVKRQTGRYILTTTANWGEPLGNSRYSVRIPSAYTLSYLSYERDSVIRKKNHLVYCFFKTNFMPDRDLIFTWATPSTKGKK
jgi:hypothetical protein